METTRPADRTTTPVLLIGDTLALLLFVFIGERNHGIADTQPVLRGLTTAAYFLLPWFISAWLLGAYGMSKPGTVRAMLSRSLNAWLIAAPLGALLRSFANGSGVILSPFLVVTLIVGGAFLVGWRVIFAALRARTLARSKAKTDVAHSMQ